MNTDPQDVARTLRQKAAEMEQDPTPDQVARRLRELASDLDSAAERLERYAERQRS